MPFFALFGILFALCSFCFSCAQHHIASWLVACYFYFVSIQSELRTCSARPPESTAHNPFLRPFPLALPLPQLTVVNVVRFHIFMCIWCVGVCVWWTRLIHPHLLRNFCTQVYLLFMVNTQGCLFILAKMYLGELNYMWMSAMVVGVGVVVQAAG